MQFTYNDFGRSIQTYQAHGGLLDDGTVNTGTSPSVQRGYANGSTNTVRPLILTYPNGRELTYDYGTTHEINDALSRIGSIVDDDTTHLVDYEFLGLAGVIQQTSPQPNLRYTLAGVSNDPDTGDIYTGLDRFGRVKDSRWYNTSTNNDLSRIQYGYDRASNRIWRKNPIATAHSAQYDWLYTYDGLQRLKTAHRGTLNGTQTALTSTAYKQDWNLDPTGNWEGFKQSDNGSTWSIEQERTANPVNEITDITNTVGNPWADPAYNAVGNMTTIPKPKQMDEAYTATYDAWNRLVKLEEEVSSTLETVAEYQYDARNFRIVVKNYLSGALDETIHAYFTDGWQNIEERTDSNYTPSQHHIWGLRYIDDCLLRDRTTDSTLDERLYALQDANWNVTTIVDQTGDVQEQIEYNAYAEYYTLTPNYSLRPESNLGWRTFHSGYQRDRISGLCIVRNRYYHTMIGRWATRDPPGYADGSSLSEYVRSRPTILTDPYGLQCQQSSQGETLEVVIQAYIPDKLVSAPHGTFAGDGQERGDKDPNWDLTPGIEDNDYRIRIRGIFDTGTGRFSYRSDAGTSILYKINPDGTFVPDVIDEAKEGEGMEHQAVYEGRPTIDGLGQYRCHVIGRGLNPVSFIPGTKIKAGPQINL
ncbi:hypothetical protein A6X21_08510 [Planctopirus hydrillae]|uniref:Uncharacterized protein n=1 Tax=Planctopirus hydrillae TaxID=1841610 RepID=A0A1C3E8B2_9PLAN|nr:hypothetical protein A6X21_08510 [Planctopirus hydrillae]